MTRSRTFALGVLLATLSASPWSSAALSAPSKPDVVAESAKDIERGAFSDAIEKLELLADQGIVHPDASFNRGVAYLDRARTPTARPGDRGRAIAGFAEALSLRPGDKEAEQGLAAAQNELERARRREGVTRTEESPSLGTLLVELLAEDTWATLALVSSLVTMLGLALLVLTRRGTPEAPASAWRLTGAVLGGVGAVSLAITGSAAGVARHTRLTARPAVVVAASARPLDAQGRPARGAPLSEGTRVRVLESQGQLLFVDAGQSRQWVRRSDVQTLATETDISRPR